MGSYNDNNDDDIPDIDPESYKKKNKAKLERMIYR